MNIITLIYLIPAILVFLIFGGIGVIGVLAGEAAGGDPATIGAAALSILGGILIAGIIAIIMAFIALFAIMRFARTDSFGEAFNFSAILNHIGKLGWGTWIIALIILLVIAIVYGFIVGLLASIPILGWLIALFLNVAFIIFYARYFALVYEETPAPA